MDKEDRVFQADSKSLKMGRERALLMCSTISGHKQEEEMS